MPATLTITSAQVIMQIGQADTVILRTNLPGASYPFERTLEVKFTAAEGTGAQYVRETFRVTAFIAGRD